MCVFVCDYIYPGVFLQCVWHRSELAAGLSTRASRSYLFSQAETDRQRETVWERERAGRWGREADTEGGRYGKKGRDTEVWEEDGQEGSTQIDKVNYSYT